MYIDNEDFEKWMAKLSKKLTEIGQDLKSLINKAYDKYHFKIHDYFAAKAVDKVKPGGIVAIVTSKFTMDKKNDKARKYLSERFNVTE